MAFPPIKIIEQVKPKFLVYLGTLSSGKLIMSVGIEKNRIAEVQSKIIDECLMPILEELTPFETLSLNVKIAGILVTHNLVMMNRGTGELMALNTITFSEKGQAYLCIDDECEDYKMSFINLLCNTIDTT